MKKIIFLALLLAASGCIVVDHGGPYYPCSGYECNQPSADIQFYWAFELADGSATDSCALAGVSTVDITIYRDGYVEFQALDRPCAEAGGLVTDFYPGHYEINLVGVCSRRSVTHEGWWTADIYSGLNDLGTLVLDLIGACH